MAVDVSMVPYVFAIKNYVHWFYVVVSTSCGMDVYLVVTYVARV